MTTTPAAASRTQGGSLDGVGTRKYVSPAATSLPSGSRPSAAGWLPASLTMVTTVPAVPKDGSGRPSGV